MPIYEYRCQSCGKELEIIQKVSDPPAVECPDCGEPSLKKKVSAAAFRLKGGGWYETDFKTGNKKNVAGESDNKPPASGTGDKAGAATPAKTGESKSSN